MSIDAENSSSETLNDSFKLENLRVQNLKIVIFSYLKKKNSVHNTFSGLTNLVFEHVDILIVAETKLDTSFLPLMPGVHKPIPLDVTTNS